MEELLDREDELSVLRGLVDDARAGRGGTVLVEGAAGSGKTALLRALRSDVDGVRVLRAVGGELEREFPSSSSRAVPSSCRCSCAWARG